MQSLPDLTSNGWGLSKMLDYIVTSRVKETSMSQDFGDSCSNFKSESASQVQDRKYLEVCEIFQMHTGEPLRSRRNR